MYAGVPGNLVAFACKLSFQRGHEGNLAFISKSQLVKHYEETLGAFHFGGRLMIIETQAALKLIDRYLKKPIKMRTKKKDLEVDFIGSQEPLTSSEEEALSEFFKKRKEIKKQKSLRPRSTTKKVTTEI